ncbi:MAG: hypothetical protein K2G35_03450 [Duncaniella sp.]|nr:hypothetical protein [Duncaniella sp.]
MTKTRSISIGKFERRAVNEDAAVARRNMIAVSDGAGGGGLFADRWSRYLVKHLPKAAIESAGQLDAWIGSIWERFYNRAEEAAKRQGGMFLDKFYDEGSFATLAAVWRGDDGECRWMAYGDTVVFCYDYATKRLRHSFTALKDFNRAPYLINCKDELDAAGFKGGSFRLGGEELVFVASDALAHYILMMYELSRREEFGAEIEAAAAAGSKNSNFVKNAMGLPPFRFEKEVAGKLRKAAHDERYCRKWLRGLYEKGLLARDDYSLGVMYE